MKKAMLPLLLVSASCLFADKSADEAIATLVAVGPKGQGNEAASKAWPKAAALEAKKLPALLSAMDDANGLGHNWLRAAVDVIVERSLKNGDKLPTKELKTFLHFPG